MPIAISFGQTLLNPENQPLREKITALGAGRLTRPLHVDTLLGVEMNPCSFSPGNERTWFLLFDYHHLFVYDDPMNDTAPHVDSIARYVVDDYPFKPFELLARHIERHPFKFFYKLETLDLLSTLWLYDRPGMVVVLDQVTGEVSVSKAHLHPEIEQEFSAKPKPVDSVLTPPADVVFVLRDREAEANLRCGAPTSLAEFISTDLGIIRGERVAFRGTQIPGAVTRVAWRRGRHEIFCGAKNFRIKDAVEVARYEAIERHQTIFPNPTEPLVYGSYAALKDVAIDPLSLFFSSMDQRSNAPQARYVRYDERTRMYWTWAHDPLGAHTRLVPAQEVWFTYFLPEESSCIGNTTNACALGSCLEEAALFAIFEAVERDAYLTMWYLRRACEKVRPESVNFEPFQLLWARTRAAFPNYRVHFFDLSADIKIPTVAAVAVREQGTGPRTLHAATTRIDATRAMFSTLVDITAELSVSRDPRKELFSNPEVVDKPEDHRDLYALDEPFARLSFMNFEAAPTLEAEDLNRRSPVRPQELYNLRSVLQDVLRHLEDAGVHVWLKDITHPVFAARQLRCVKAVSQGLYPMWFGYHDVRFALTERLRRLAQHSGVPPPESEGDVNLELHPFS